MERLQIYLEASQRLRLAELARARGQPAAVLIREAVERYLGQEQCGVSAGDSLFSLIGAARGLETARDVSAQHHRYLAHGHTSEASTVSPRAARRSRALPRKKSGRQR